MESVKATAWDRQYEEQRGIRWWPSEELIRFIGRTFGASQKEQHHEHEILDIGCGAGGNSRFLLEEGFSVVAIDSSQAAVDLATIMLTDPPRRSPLHQTAQIQLGSVLNLSSDWANRMAGIIDIQTIQHLTYQQHCQAYQELFVALKPGGFFFSIHMHEQHWDAKYGGGNRIDEFTVDNCSDEVSLFPNNGITCFLPAHAMKNLLLTSGFIVESIETFMRTYKQRTREARYLVTVATKE